MSILSSMLLSDPLAMPPTTVEWRRLDWRALGAQKLKDRHDKVLKLSYHRIL